MISQHVVERTVYAIVHVVFHTVLHVDVDHFVLLNLVLHQVRLELQQTLAADDLSVLLNLLVIVGERFLGDDLGDASENGGSIVSTRFGDDLQVFNVVHRKVALNCEVDGLGNFVERHSRIGDAWEATTDVEQVHLEAHLQRIVEHNLGVLQIEEAKVSHN